MSYKASIPKMKGGRELFLTMIRVVNELGGKETAQRTHLCLPEPCPLKVHIHPGQKSHSECFLPIFLFLLV